MLNPWGSPRGPTSAVPRGDEVSAARGRAPPSWIGYGRIDPYNKQNVGEKKQPWRPGGGRAKRMWRCREIVFKENAKNTT